MIPCISSKIHFENTCYLSCMQPLCNFKQLHIYVYICMYLENSKGIKFLLYTTWVVSRTFIQIIMQGESGDWGKKERKKHIALCLEVPLNSALFNRLSSWLETLWSVSFTYFCKLFKYPSVCRIEQYSGVAFNVSTQSKYT